MIFVILSLIFINKSKIIKAIPIESNFINVIHDTTFLNKYKKTN